MDLMEQLLCPQVCMDVEDTPLEIETPLNAPDEPAEAEPSSLPIELRVRLILDNEFKFQPEQIPHELLPNEQVWFPENFSEVEFLKQAKLNCTVCNRHIGTSLVEQVVRYIHPELNTLMCHPCFKFYGSGEFEKDEDGSEIYCKWCGQGGNVVCCSDCSLVFCQNCLKRNLGVHGLAKIKNSDNWSCFKCDPQQLTKFHLACYVLHQYSTKQLRYAVRTKNLFLVKDDFSTCCQKRKRRKSVNSDDENDEFLPRNEGNERKPRPKSKKTSNTHLNKEPRRNSTIMPKRALATLNSATSNNNAIYQSVQPQASLTTPSVSQPLIKFSVAPPTNPTSDANMPTLAELLPSLFTTLGTPAITSGTLIPTQIPGAGPAAVRVSLNTPNAATAAAPRITKKTFWLLNAINACRFHAQSLIAQADAVQSKIRENSSGQELADLHNTLQREMTACSNRLSLCRKNMHKEFLRYLTANNISHSSHPTTQGSSGAGRSNYAAKSTTPRMPSLRKLTVPARSEQQATAAQPQRPVLTAAIDLCDDDDDDCMVEDRNGNSNGTLDDPLAVSDDDDDDDDSNAFEPTVVLDTSESESEAPTAPPVERNTAIRTAPKSLDNKSPLSDKEYRRACSARVVLDRDMSLDSTKYLTKNKANRVVPDLVRDSDDVLSSLELVGVASDKRRNSQADSPQTETDPEDDTTNKDDEQSHDDVVATTMSSGFDFVREMQNEMSQSNSLLGVDISKPPTPSIEANPPPSVSKVDENEKPEIDMAEVVLEAIKQLTETIVQNIDSNDNVRSESDVVGVDKVADIVQTDAPMVPIDNVSDLSETSENNLIPEIPEMPENLESVAQPLTSGKDDSSSNVSFNDPTPPAICLEDMVKIYEACDTTIDGDMVPPDE